MGTGAIFTVPCSPFTVSGLVALTADGGAGSALASPLTVKRGPPASGSLPSASAEKATVVGVPLTRTPLPVQATANTPWSLAVRAVVPATSTVPAAFPGAVAFAVEVPPAAYAEPVSPVTAIPPARTPAAKGGGGRQGGFRSGPVGTLDVSRP
ncbi:MAG: hypothetical protein ACRDP6_49830 [Actinoallomurus sp.]